MQLMKYLQCMCKVHEKYHYAKLLIEQCVLMQFLESIRV